jgi:peptide/nickel transport system ATP-binding protein
MENLLELKNITKCYLTFGDKGEKQFVKAVDGVDLEIKKDEILGLVGESGCGKTTLGKLILGLIPPTSGDIIFSGKSLVDNINKKSKRDLIRKMSAVFQDPYYSLNPRMNVFELVKEPLTVIADKKKYKGDLLIEAVLEILNNVGLSKEHLFRYPHEFSGGQRQRIAIARALINNPVFIVLDEPTSALDVSVQAQILNLLEKLKEKFNITYLFISHNMGVVKYISSHIAVMYKGKIVEFAKCSDLFKNPIHPYTKCLLDAVPDLNIKKEKINEQLNDDVYNYKTNLGKEKCSFINRCPFKNSKCDANYPDKTLINSDHYVYCNNI